MEHGRTVAIPDIYEDERIPHDAYRPTFVKSLAMVPVRQEEPIAALGAFPQVRDHDVEPRGRTLEHPAHMVARPVADRRVRVA